MDGGAAATQSAIKSAVQTSVKSKLISTRNGKLILDQAQRNYLIAWQNTWTIPRQIINCGPLSQCTAVNLAEIQSKYRAAVQNLFNIGSDLSKKLKALGKKTEKIVKRLDPALKKTFDQNILLLESVPGTTAKCG